MFLIIGLGNTKFSKIIDPSGTPVSYLRFTTRLIVKPNGNHQNFLHFKYISPINVVVGMKITSIFPS